MNKRIHTTEIVGNMGVLVMNSEQPSTLWHNGENIDIVKTVTNIQLDQAQLQQQIRNEIVINGIPLIEEQFQRLMKSKVHFDMVSWINEDGVPEVTCQLFYGDKMISEKTTLITPKGTENVASPT